MAIVGYTNAGKSSLLNRLTGAGVLVEDALFATLDPTTRRVGDRRRARLHAHRHRRLRPPPAARPRRGLRAPRWRSRPRPTCCCTSSTAPTPTPRARSRAVHEVLAADRRRQGLRARRDQQGRPRRPPRRSPRSGRATATRSSSRARTGEGFDELRQHDRGAAAAARGRGPTRCIPYERGDLVNRIHQAGELLTTEHTGDGTLVVARVNADLAGELAAVRAGTRDRRPHRPRWLSRPSRRRRRRPDRGRRTDASSPVTGSVLDDAVAGIGGADRPGQHAMADAVAQALDDGRHLLVQAGTGTGKSLGYLAPALVWLTEHPGERIVVATATLALQAQLAQSDIPAAVDAVEHVTGRRPEFSVLKGRSNYACLLRVRDGGHVRPGHAHLRRRPGRDRPDRRPTADSALGAEVLALREWAEDQASTGGVGRPRRRPAHSDRAWHQVSVPARECLGAQRCPYGDSCLVELLPRPRPFREPGRHQPRAARDRRHARRHRRCPSTGAVIVDEAHELVARVTGAASGELSPQQVERVGKRALTFLTDETALDAARGGRRPARRARRGAAGAGRGPVLGVRRRRPAGPRRRAGGRVRADHGDREGDARAAAGRRRGRARSSTSPSGWPRCRRTTWSG